MKPHFAQGQRWHSTTEPELGLGRVELVEGREVVIAFPAREVVRRYAIEDAPLARVRLIEGQRARGQDGTDFRIEEIIESGDVVLFRGEGHELSETDLDAQLDIAMPEHRLRTGHVDELALFDLRHEALSIRHQMLASPARGFLGGHIRLLEHQLSIARDVCDRHRVRVLLADEVGLGKTIEALLILHRLLLCGRVERALVLVPPALVHQWLAEAYHRFDLILRVLGGESLDASADEMEHEDLPSALLSGQLFICSFGAADAESLTSASWDVLIVDEVHHLQPETADFALVQELSTQIDHVVFLSAMPHADGEAMHFARLAMLDPERFHDGEAYRHESENYQELAETAERLQRGDSLVERDRELLRARLASPDTEELIAAADRERAAQKTLLSRLLDLHGIGRVMFRNVRARTPGFPRRVPCAVELEGGNRERLTAEFLNDIGRGTAFKLGSVRRDPRTAWLQGFAAAHPGEKMLVLCSSSDKVERFATSLTASKHEVARFHERMSSIARDRQAAWFLAPGGPQILFSSALGAEGRNFQVARHLVLLDLPLTADGLEQRIGRVDRIGQGEQVWIHAVAVAGTPQARLRRWHAEALHVFDRPWHGSPAIDREFGEELVAALLAPDEAAIDNLIERGRERNQQIVTELENGRDRLLELASCDVDATRELQEIIDRAEQSSELEWFMVHAFERAGIDVERIGGRSYVLRTGADYHRTFVGLVGREMAVTFDRENALGHPDRTLLTTDHPMVRDTIDTLLASDTGNACVAKLVGEAAGLLLEAMYVAEPTVPRALRADRFLPPTPIRVVVDAGGREEEGRRVAADSLEPIDSALLENPNVGAHLHELLERARERATARGEEIATAARADMRRELEPAVARLMALATVNPAVSKLEIEAAQAEMTALDDGLAEFRIRLDALRLIVVMPESA